MTNKIDIQSILEKEVTRRQFLMQIGLALLAVVGIPAFLKGLNSAFETGSKSSATQSLAYGESPYSGTNSLSSATVTKKIVEVR